MQIINRWREYRRVRRERYLQKVRRWVREGRCLCASPGNCVDHNCPQAPLHFKQWLGYRTFRCDNDHLVMQRNWPVNCSGCGSTSFVETDVQEMLDYTKEQLLEIYA